MTVSERYHAIFNFKLVKSDFPRWLYKDDKSITGITGRKSITRIKREQISKKKLQIARKAAKILGKISTVRFVGVTGALAMFNANIDSDIDLLIITSKNRLWLTRLCVYYILHTTYYILRKPRSSYERDALCLNMWLDEDDLVWNKRDRNIYTAHEIAQIIPLVNKDSIYEKFLYLNRWILNFWPYAVLISSKQQVESSMQKRKPILHTTYYILQLIEKLAFKLQYLYMKNKITREVVTPTRALFHPKNWSEVVLQKLKIN